MTIAPFHKRICRMFFLGAVSFSYFPLSVASIIDQLHPEKLFLLIHMLDHEPAVHYAPE